MNRHLKLVSASLAACLIMLLPFPGLRNNARRARRRGNSGFPHTYACTGVGRTGGNTRANTNTHGSANDDAYADICTDGHASTNAHGHSGAITDAYTPTDGHSGANAYPYTPADGHSGANADSQPPAVEDLRVRKGRA